MTRTLSLVVVMLAACHQSDDARQRALAQLQKATLVPVPAVVEVCGPGSAMAGVAGCNLEDAERAERRTQVRRQLREVVGSFYIGAKRNSAAIIQTVASNAQFGEELARAVADKDGCNSPVVGAELRNLLHAALTAAVEGKDTAPELIVPPGALKTVDGLTDSALNRCFGQHTGSQQTDQDVDKLVAAALGRS